MKHLAAILALVIGASFFTTCKKGKDDPAFSLLTRKARLAGDWTVESGTVSFTYLFRPDPPYNELYSFTGSDLKLNTTEFNQTPTIYVGKYLLNLTFKKDGSFSLTETITGTSVSAFSASGTWNFTSGVGKAKNKDGVILRINSVTGGESDGHLFNRFGTELTYSIAGLRNKKLSLESSGLVYQAGNGDKISYGSQYTFKARGN